MQQWTLEIGRKKNLCQFVNGVEKSKAWFIIIAIYWEWNFFVLFFLSIISEENNFSFVLFNTEA